MLLIISNWDKMKMMRIKKKKKMSTMSKIDLNISQTGKG